MAVPILKDLRNPNSTLGNSVITELKNSAAWGTTPANRRNRRAYRGPRHHQIPGRQRVLSLALLPNLTLDQALRLKTILGEIADSKAGLDSMSDIAAKTTAETYAKQIDAGIRKGLSRTSDLLREYDSAVQHYAEGVATFKTKWSKGGRRAHQNPGALNRSCSNPNSAR